MRISATEYEAVDQRRIQQVKEMDSATCVHYTSLSVLDHPAVFDFSIDFHLNRIRSRPPYCGSFSRIKPLSVMICDNASVYHGSELVRISHDAGILLKYFPPYSPDLNPVETMFSALKVWIKRYRYIAVLFFNEGRYSNFMDPLCTH